MPPASLGALDDLHASAARADVGPIKDVDPTHAAKRRSAQRADHRRRMAERRMVRMVTRPAAC